MPHSILAVSISQLLSETSQHVVKSYIVHHMLSSTYSTLPLSPSGFCQVPSKTVLEKAPVVCGWRKIHKCTVKRWGKAMVQTYRLRLLTFTLLCERWMDILQ